MNKIFISIVFLIVTLVSCDDDFLNEDVTKPAAKKGAEMKVAPSEQATTTPEEAARRNAIETAHKARR